MKSVQKVHDDDFGSNAKVLINTLTRTSDKHSHVYVPKAVSVGGRDGHSCLSSLN